MRRNLHKTLGLQRIKHDLAAHVAPAWRTSEVESVPGRRCESSLGELRPTPFAAPEAIVELLGKCQKKHAQGLDPTENPEKFGVVEYSVTHSNS